MKRVLVLTIVVLSATMLLMIGCQQKPASPPETGAPPMTGAGAPPAMDQPHPPVTPMAGAGGVEAPAAGSIAKAEGGQTVADVYGGKTDLAGKTVKVKGKVMKVSQQIMGRNWIHVQDGSGDSGSNDLTVTSDAVPNVGDVVVIEGTLAADKDFGAGYTYAVIVENATVTPAK